MCLPTALDHAAIPAQLPPAVELGDADVLVVVEVCLLDVVELVVLAGLLVVVEVVVLVVVGLLVVVGDPLPPHALTDQRGFSGVDRHKLR